MFAGHDGGCTTHFAGPAPKAAQPVNPKGISIKLAYRRTIPLVVLVVMSLPANAVNCKLAAGKTEDMICKNSDLIWLDDSLNHVYRAAVAKSKEPVKIKSEQKRWISEVRASCATPECLKSAYLSRVAWLQKEMGSWCESQRERLAGSWERIGGDGFFEAFSTGPDGELDSWLHQRPEISGGTWKLVGCNFVATSQSGLSVNWIIIDVTKSELRALEVGIPGLARYRRTSN